MIQKTIRLISATANQSILEFNPYQIMFLFEERQFCSMANKLLMMAVVLFFLLGTAAYAEHYGDTEGKTGSIADFSYYPEKPMFSKAVITSFAVKNIGDARQTFRLKLFVIKDGNIVKQTDNFLSVYPGQKKGNSSEFYPKEIGSYEILAKLYDNYETKLLDIMSAKMIVESELGPFDLILNPLARKIRPEEELPILLTIINKGITGTDASVRIEVKCQPNSISNEFMIFAPPDREIEKMVTMPACGEEGAHTIESSISISNRTYAISTAQFFVNDTLFMMDLKMPRELLLEQGESKLFDITVRNTAPYPLHNVRLFSEGFPLGWITIQPNSIAYIGLNETAIFLVSLKLPEDAEARVYSAKFIASSDELSNRESSVLKVMEAEVVPLSAAGKAQSLLGLYGAYILAAISAAALLALVRAKTRKTRRASLAPLRPLLRHNKNME